MWFNLFFDNEFFMPPGYNNCCSVMHYWAAQPTMLLATTSQPFHNHFATTWLDWRNAPIGLAELWMIYRFTTYQDARRVSPVNWNTNTYEKLGQLPYSYTGISSDRDSFSPISRLGSILTLCHGGLFGISVRKYIDSCCFQFDVVFNSIVDVVFNSKIDCRVI